MNHQSTDYIELDKKECYIASVSIIEVGGPYHENSLLYEHLSKFHQNQYDAILNDLERESRVLLSNVPLVIETLNLSKNVDDQDFSAIYRNDIKNSDIGVIDRHDIDELCIKLNNACLE